MGRQNDFFPPPLEENPKGFYENRRFRDINDRILQSLDYDVKSFSTSIPDVHAINPLWREEMMNLITEYNKEFKYWGWKDPRTCLTLSAWLQALWDFNLTKDLKILHIFRDHTDVAKSMRARGNEEVERNQFYTLSTKYHYRALQYLAAFYHKVQVLPLYFRELMNNTGLTSERINDFLGEKLITDTSFIDPAISKNSGYTEKISPSDAISARSSEK